MLCSTPSHNTTSRMPLKNSRSAGNGAYVQIYNQMTTIPGNYRWLFVW
jgi:hypothetical protein